MPLRVIKKNGVIKNAILIKKMPFFEKLSWTFKSLVLVLANSVLVTNSGNKVVFKKIPYIKYLV